MALIGDTISGNHRKKRHKQSNKGLVFKQNIRGILIRYTIGEYNKIKKRRAKNKVARKQRRINRLNSK